MKGDAAPAALRDLVRLSDGWVRGTKADGKCVQVAPEVWDRLRASDPSLPERASLRRVTLAEHYQGWAERTTIRLPPSAAQTRAAARRGSAPIAPPKRRRR